MAVEAIEERNDQSECICHVYLTVLMFDSPTTQISVWTIFFLSMRGSEKSKKSKKSWRINISFFSLLFSVWVNILFFSFRIEIFCLIIFTTPNDVIVHFRLAFSLLRFISILSSFTPIVCLCAHVIIRPFRDETDKLGIITFMCVVAKRIFGRCHFIWNSAVNISSLS